MQSLIRRTTAFLTPSSSTTNLIPTSTPDSQTFIFPTVSTSTDGPDCLADCSSCTIHYPAKWSIDESDELYGHVQGWATHLLIATGKSDWVRDIADERGSLMEAVGGYLEGKKKKKDDDGGGEEEAGLANGRCMVSACNVPVPEGGGGGEEGETDVVVLPSWEVVERVAPSRVQDLMEGYVARASTTESPAPPRRHEPRQMHIPDSAKAASQPPTQSPALDILPSPIPPTPRRTPSPQPAHNFPFPTRPLPHRALILLCSQKTRDARCGQSAPLLRREFERHLRPLGLYRDLHDDRPGGVGIYFISHVGGHRYSANVIVYRRGGGWEGALVGEAAEGEGKGGRMEIDGGTGESMGGGGGGGGEAMQGIWLARVRPEDCEGIIKYTVLKGKVVKPERQLRGGFDRTRGLTSW